MLSDKKRLFLAISLPEARRRELVNIQDELKRRLSPRAVKWVEEENLHITLVFLGETPFSRVTIIKDKLSEIEASSFSLRLSRLGFFPDERKPRVVWVGLTGEVEKLQALYNNIRKVLKNEGIFFDQKFYPHVTLGRVRLGYHIRLTLNKKIERILKLSKKFQVEEFSLMESILTDQGPRHIALKKFPLV
jgi:2'-5' RNA ligase